MLRAMAVSFLGRCLEPPRDLGHWALQEEQELPFSVAELLLAQYSDCSDANNYFIYLLLGAEFMSP